MVNKTVPMNDISPPATKEERLAAKLRENLRRRKAQSRAQTDTENLASAALSKPGVKS